MKADRERRKQTVHLMPKVRLFLSKETDSILKRHTNCDVGLLETRHLMVSGVLLQQLRIYSHLHFDQGRDRIYLIVMQQSKRILEINW